MRHFIVRNSMSVNQALAGYHPRNRLRVLKSKCLALYGVESRVVETETETKRFETEIETETSIFSETETTLIYPPFII